MNNKSLFSYNITDSNRPQVLLIENGLELDCEVTSSDFRGVSKQLTWAELVDEITVEKNFDIDKKDKPFPLLYSILSVPNPAPSTLGRNMIFEEEKRLQSAMNKLSQSSTWRLDALKNPSMDHILTTNYSYGLD